jgi:hypothetical protein
MMKKYFISNVHLSNNNKKTGRRFALKHLEQFLTLIYYGKFRELKAVIDAKSKTKLLHRFFEDLKKGWHVLLKKD